jgi:hypothetical protein
MKIRKSKEILFYPVDEMSSKFIEPPLPASKNNIPDDFKKLPKYSYNTKSFINYGGSSNNLTVKSCLPTVDAYTSGYTISLPYDIQVHRDENNQASITWSLIVEGLHAFINKRTDMNENIHPWDNIDGYDNLEFNWMPYWSIKTPPGYSSMFIHPINRMDLPFYTIGGIMDTDGWGDVGNHPFMFKKNWSGIIPAGTPVIQIIPFKRDDWDSNIDKTMIDEYWKKIITRDKKLKNYYKTNHWKSKQYR